MPVRTRCLAMALLAIAAAPAQADPTVTIHPGPGFRLPAEVRTVTPASHGMVVQASAGAPDTGVTVVRGGSRAGAPAPALAQVLASLCGPAPDAVASLAETYRSGIARSP